MDFTYNTIQNKTVEFPYEGEKKKRKKKAAFSLLLMNLLYFQHCMSVCQQSYVRFSLNCATLCQLQKQIDTV